MNPFMEMKKAPPIRGVAWRGEVSLWNIDTAFSRLYDRAMESRVMFRQPAVGLRHDGVAIPGMFRSDYEVLFPLAEGPDGPPSGMEIRDLPEEDVASFIHRGPYEWIQCTYEKVLDWLRENRYEVAGVPREIFFVAPEPHSGGTQDDMLTEIQVPVQKAA